MSRGYHRRATIKTPVYQRVTDGTKGTLDEAQSHIDCRKKEVRQKLQQMLSHCGPIKWGE